EPARLPRLARARAQASGRLRARGRRPGGRCGRARAAHRRAGREMRRLLGPLAAVSLWAALAATAAGAPPPRVFAVVPSTPTVAIAAAESPNMPGTLVLPPAYLSPRGS